MTLSGELKINSKNVSHHVHYILANMFNTVSFIFFTTHHLQTAVYQLYKRLERRRYERKFYS